MSELKYSYGNTDLELIFAVRNVFYFKFYNFFSEAFSQNFELVQVFS